MISGMAVWGGAGWLLDRWLGHAVFFPRSASSSAWRSPSTWWSPGTAPSTRLRGSGHGKTPGGRRSRPGGTSDAEGTTVTSSALALGSVLAAGPGFEAPGLEAFYPEPLVTLHAAGHRLRDHPDHADPVDRDDARSSRFLVATVRKPQIVPGKLQFLGESGYSLVRDGIARDVVGPARPAVRARSSPRCSSSSSRTT